MKQHQRKSRLSTYAIQNNEGHILGTGSGVKIKGRYYVLTAFHVIIESKEIYASNGNNIYQLSAEWVDIKNDLALMSTVEEIHMLDRKNHAKPRRAKIRENLIGLDVCYTGFPNGIGPSTNCGIIGGTHDNCIIMQNYAWFGSSGSGVFDTSGQIIGVISAIGSDGYSGMPLQSSICVIPIVNSIIDDWLKIK